MGTLKQKNKEIVQKIEDCILEKSQLYDEENKKIEVLIEYINNSGEKEHQVGHYFVNSSGHIIGTIGSVFDFDFYGLREITNFWPLEDIFETLSSNSFFIDELDLDSEEEPEIEYLDYKAEDIKVGDYMFTDGPSSFCTGSYIRIEKIVTRYDEETGSPYLVFIDDDDNWYDSRTGACISNENSMYSVEFYGRLKNK